ncbi:MAG: MFS transporter [Gracilimonas sp.]|uniref:MFS transporter n=1 Tax=Gracilimonas TaxID=649462 RepID=UPI001B0AB5D0|nr:MFS transporter [Gracilimonas sp.]MBO6586933.1 MFS transporter [Gracilimonas sp.]MBO6614579.1 MFS transporter [Gracilimonas sp.]
MNLIAKLKENPWFWIPSLYYAQGLPYIMVVEVSVIMYQNLDISNAEIGLYTSLLYLPWIIKPFWSPLVENTKTKRWWTIGMQFVMGAAFAGVALVLLTPSFFAFSLIVLYLLALASATHDIAADGFYMIALNEEKQSFFVGIRSTFYRIAIISGKGALVILAGYLIESGTDVDYAWAVTFGILAVVMTVFALYHTLSIPKPAGDYAEEYDSPKEQLAAFFKVFIDFFKKKQIWVALAFILFYRFAEGQLVKMGPPFFLDEINAGGLGLSTSDLGFIYGTIGVIALTIGGIIGGVVISRKGLKYWLWPMLIAMNVPNLVYVILAYFQPESYTLISAFVAIEQFGYGFGFAAFLMFLIYIARGENKTAHYAFGTGFMALGMLIPGSISGFMQEWLGYLDFFIWVMIATIPIFIVTKFVDIDPDFGKKKDKQEAENN